jgi:hypothetical protein
MRANDSMLKRAEDFAWDKTRDSTHG